MSSHLIRPAAEEKRPWRYMELAASVYTLALLCIFPFVVHNKYFDILPTKYQAYAVLTCAALIFTVIYLIASGAAVRGIQSLRDGTWKGHLSFVDWSVLAFEALLIFSTLQSEFPYESFWGNEGRYTGLYHVAVCVLVFFHQPFSAVEAVVSGRVSGGRNISLPVGNYRLFPHGHFSF